MLPNVIVIGASKCGTTSLHEYFSRHPDIFVPSKKELHYHSSKELMKHNGGPGDKYVLKEICTTQQEYADYYQNSTCTVNADVSPSYLFFPSCIDSIKNLCGEDVKIICMVRHPADKIVSQYSHLLYEGREKKSFEEALSAEAARKQENYSDMWLYFESAFMSEKIKAFKNAFKNVLVINAADLKNNSADTLKTIYSFIHVDENKMIHATDVAKNYSAVPKSMLISKVFIQPNLFTNFLRKIIPQKIGKVVREWISTKNKGESFSVSALLKAKLENELLGEIESLNMLIDSPGKINIQYA